MSGLQKIATNGADELIVLSRADYERLIERIEDAEDLAHAKAFDAAYARGDVELLPLDLVKRLRRGEHPLTVWRDHRGFTQKALAAAKSAHSSSVELPAHLLYARLLAVDGSKARALAELALVREGLSRYASVPLRLLVLETALLVTHRLQDAFALAHYRFDESSGAMVPASHNGAGARAAATNFVVLRDGGIYFEGGPVAIKDSQDPYVRRFLV